MSKTITSAGILSNVYNSRALITDNFDNHVLLRARDGGLWAVLKENKEDESINIYYSDNEGFEWYWLFSGDLTSENLRESFINVNTAGSHISAQIFEDQNLLLIWHGYWNTSTLSYDMEPFLFSIGSPLSGITRATGDNFPTEIVLDADYSIDGSNNEKSSYVSYINLTQLKIKRFSPSNILNSSTSSSGLTNCYNTFSSVATKNGYVDHIVYQQYGTGNRVLHIRWFETLGWLTPNVIEEHDTNVIVTDITLSYDAYGTLFAAWMERDSLTNVSVIHYYIATDENATNWTEVEVPYSPGHSVYRDKITNQPRARLTSMGGLQGFIFSYVRDNTNGIPKTFVRTVTTTDGLTYTMQDEREVGTSITNASDSVVGLRFFKPTSSTLMDLSDPGKVSVCLQIGEGNSATQNDILPVRIAQETLVSSAYPLNPDTSSYELDSGDQSNLLVTLNVLGGPSENIDYYNLGLTGAYTNRYLAGFDRIATNVEFFRYEPVFNSEMNDTSAYSSPVNYNTGVIFEVNSYQFPLSNSNNETYENYIERDIRQIHIRPDFHLERTFLVNKGNFFKRTIWTLLYDGNEYEISQVVPYFIKNEIAYYTANIYVIGPGNNPFSKRTLPSET